jgi:hypothetical protein
MPTETSKMTGAYCYSVSKKAEIRPGSFLRSTYISDEINSRELLHELAAYPKKCSTTESLWTGLEEGEERGAACCCSLLFQCVFDFVHFSIDYSVILRD